MLRRIACLWIGVVLLAAALAPAADTAAGRSLAIDAGDLLLICAGGLLLGRGVRCSFGRDAPGRVRGRRSLFAVAAVLAVAAAVVPLTFAQQVAALAASSLGGYAT